MSRLDVSPPSTSHPATALALALAAALAAAGCSSGGGDPAPAPADAAADVEGAGADAAVDTGDAAGDAGATAASDPALDAFAEQVAQALEAGDVEALTPVLSDPFALGYDGSEWQVLDAPAAAAALRTTHVPAGTTLDVANSDRAVRDALAGRVDVDGLFGAQSGVSRMLLATGWDGESDRQGVVFLTPGQGPDGGYVWTALLIVR